MRRCEDDIYVDVKMGKREDEKMICVDVKMGRCED